MSKCRGLRNLVPIVLDGPIPKTASQGLVGSGCEALDDSERLHFIESISVSITGQSGRRSKTKLTRALQGEGRDMGPTRELGLRRKIRWRRLEISRGGAEDKGCRWSIRSVVAPGCEDLISDCLSDSDAFGLVWSVGDQRQRLFKLGIQRCLEGRVQRFKNFVRGGRGGRVLRSGAGNTSEA